MKTFFKLTSLTAVALLLGTASLQAQDRTQPLFGIKGGLNATTLQSGTDRIEEDNLRLGFNAGVFVRVPVNSFFSVQPELLYTTYGTKRSYTLSGTPDGTIFDREDEARMNLNYVQLPVLALFHITPWLNVQVGPYASYLLSASVESDLDGNSLDMVSGLDRDDFNAIDFGGSAGIGLDIDRFTIDARYNMGLREIGDEGVAGFLTRDARNSAFQLSLGIGF